MLKTLANTRWLDFKRFFVGEGPQPAPYFLHYRRVYIFPTRQGFIFGLVLIAMLLGSINYNNNLGYIFTFLLASLAITTIFFTYQNLLHLNVGPAVCKPFFANQPANLAIQINNRRFGNKYALKAHFPQHEPVYFDVAANEIITINLPLTFASRGEHGIPRFTLETNFPLGLFRAWSPIHLNQTILVYPTPSNDKQLPQNSFGMHTGQHAAVLGNDDYDGLRNYQLGDALHRIHWKSAARHQTLYTKQYIGSAATELWLDWTNSTLGDIEFRLSQLTRWILLADAAGISYGLRLPESVIQPNSGAEHKHLCLRSLALFGKPHEH